MTIKTIYLTGQNNFGNRGCEALVRSTVTVLTEQFGPIKVLVPSLDPVRDAAQWPGCNELGVEFVQAYGMPRIFSKVAGACQKFNWIHRLIKPTPNLDAGLKRDIERSDILLSVGGDNISLDYGLASLYYFCAIADYALSLGKPALLWGASVGPFSKNPIAEGNVADHLKRMSLVTIRESRSIEYLRGIGVSSNVVPVVDSAFAMVPEAVNIGPWWPVDEGGGGGVLGLNVGWLIDSIRRRNGSPDGVVSEVVEFVQGILASTNMSIILVPHVSPLNGDAFNNDEIFNEKLMQACGGVNPRLSQVPRGFNAAQLKYVISKCRFLIGARTHATIAAFSTAVPTISIAYSVKAKGINRDLFGHERYVLETPSVSAKTLRESLDLLVAEEVGIREQYDSVLPTARINARKGAVRLSEIVAR
ncbi:MAG: polysaccharide pyruvyl transferase family protein [Paucibacter sp.]|nr:polysaccharide pyruvyl transferase family protein [Roseateles sp.]